MFTFVKSLNNNIALAYDASGEEAIIIGTGIGFKKEKGEQISPDAVSKVYQKQIDDKLVRLLTEIPATAFELTDDIVSIAEKEELKLFPSIYLTLSDHIGMAMKRLEDNIEINNPLGLEISHMFPTEYKISEQAMDIAADKYGIVFPQSEKGLIAIHLMNGQIEQTNIQNIMKLTKITSEILEKIAQYFSVDMCETSMSYSRFVTHILYFLLRQQKKEEQELILNDSFEEILKQKFSDSYACAKEISVFLAEKYNIEPTTDEEIYLVLHIERILSEL